jgi:photosystem II stability/assembly factor-like uncharacterized protein
MSDQTAIEHDAVYALAQSNSDLYAARLSGLYRSQDGGVSWQNTFESLDQSLAGTAVVVNGNTVFAGVNGAVLRSDDAGTSWQVAALSSPAPNVAALVISPRFNEDGFIAAGTADDGVFISNDGGLNWTAWNFGLIDLHIYVLLISPDFEHDHTLYAGTESGIFRSLNGGRAWHELPFPMTAAPVLSLTISPSFAVDGRLYGGTESQGLYFSDDRGLHWQHVSDALAATLPGTAINALEISESDSMSVFALLGEQLLYTDNGGQSWLQCKEFPSGKLAMTMLVDSASADSVWVGFSDGSVTQVRRAKS